MLNKLAGEDRVVVDNVAGTTRDPVDELIELGGKTWRFVDTAGIRRRVHLTRGADFYASLRTQAAIEKAEVAVVLIDAEENIAEQDVRVVQQVIDAGRALVSLSTSGTCWTKSADTSSSVRSSATSPRCVGAQGEHLGHGPADTSTDWCPDWRSRSTPGISACPPVG